MKAEEVKVGGYQVLSLLLLSINFIVVAMSHVIQLFYRYTPKFYCEDSTEVIAMSPQQVVVSNRTYGCMEGGCPGRYIFEPVNRAERSVAMEWQLICEREGLLKLGTDVYYGGLLVGGLVSGILADRIGRLPVLAICLYAQGTMAVALNVVQDYQWFLAFRGLQGFFVQGLETCTYILCMELFPTKFRTLVALTVLSMRSFGLSIISGLDYSIMDWRILQLVVSVPTAVTVLYIWMIPESPRWLLAKGKTTEAEILLEKIGNYNSLCGPSAESCEDTEKGQESGEREEKPQKPKRKMKQADDDVEKSPEESVNLLKQPRSAQNGTGEKTVEENTEEKKCDMPTSLSIDEIAKASVLVVEDEKKSSANNKEEEGSSGPSYLLVSKELFSPNESNQLNARRGFLAFFESKYIGSTCLLLMCLWFTTSTVFHSNVSLPQRPNVERHVSLVIAAGMELGTFVIVYLLVSSSCGRRVTLCATQLTTGLALVTIAVFTFVDMRPFVGDFIDSVKMGIVSFGKVANIGTFFTLRLVVIELLPTISRGTGVGLCIGADMIGALLTPYILILNKYVDGLPRCLIGLLCICTGLLSLIFPETLRTVLPDTVKEAKRLGREDNEAAQRSKNPEVLREKLFSEDWVDAGNGIIVNFTDNKNSE